jgi:predicted membrane protein
MNRSRVLTGVLLVVLGGVFLLDALEVASAGAILSDWWPLAIVAVGAAQLLERPPRTVGGLTFVVIGAVLLTVTLDVVDASLIGLVWPVALVIAGIWFMLGRPRARDRSAADDVDLFALFSGREIACDAATFRGGSATAIFGGVEIDLRDALPVAEGAVLDVTALFGGVELTVPHGWRVRSDGPVILGGVDIEGDRGPLPDDAPTLRLRTLVAFGGVDVKRGYPHQPAAPVQDLTSV